MFEVRIQTESAHLVAKFSWAQDDHEAIDHQRVLEALEACAELNAVEIRGDARKEWGV